MSGANTVMDIKTFRERYPDWLEANRAHLEAANWKEAFKTYPYPVNDSAPWTPLEKPLSQCTLAVLTTAGLYLKDSQPPFDAPNIEGDWTLRQLPADASPADLGIAHTHFPHESAEMDLNAVYPLERLRELVAEGRIGALADTHYSISGFCTRPDLVVENSVPPLLAALGVAGTAGGPAVDIVLHIPV